MPREEGLVKVEKERFLTVAEITLTRKPTEEQKKAVEYQDPIKGVEREFLNKESWEKGEQERAERRQEREARRGERPERGERQERGQRQEREPRGDRNETRGGERRRGGRR